MAQIALCCVVSILVSAPIWFFDTDHWDGAIVTRALDRGDIQTVLHWNSEIRTPFFTGFTLGIHWISVNLIPISWKTYAVLGNCFMAIGQMLILRQIAFRRFMPIQVLLLSSITPLIFLSTSSVLGQFHIFFGLILIGCSLLPSRNLGISMLGVILVIIGSDWKVAVPVAGVLGLAMVINAAFLNHKIRFSRIALPFIFTAVHVIIFMVWLKPNGLYENYGTIIMPKFQSIVDLFKPHQDLFLPAVSVIIFLIYPVLKFFSGFSWRLGRMTAIILMLSFGLFASHIPYLLTGRSPVWLLDIRKYPLSSQNLRYAIIGTSLGFMIITLCWYHFVTFHKNILLLKYFPKQLFINVHFLVGIAIFSSVLWIGWAGQFELQSIKREVIVSWSNKTWNENTVCKIPNSDSSVTPRYNFNIYELTHMMEDAKKVTNVVPCQGSYCKFPSSRSFLETVCEYPPYKSKYSLHGLNCAIAVPYAQSQSDFVSCFVE